MHRRTDSHSDAIPHDVLPAEAVAGFLHIVHFLALCSEDCDEWVYCLFQLTELDYFMCSENHKNSTNTLQPLFQQTPLVYFQQLQF